MRDSTRHCLSASIFAGLIVAGVESRAVDAALTETCESCHGEVGVSSKEKIPTIAGITQLVLEDYLTAFAEKSRPCRAEAFEEADVADHCAAASKLSEAQRTSLAEHYAAKGFVAASQKVDAAAAAKGKAIHEKQCARCHSDGGGNPEDDASILAGQWMPYLRQTFVDYGSSARSQPKTMKLKIDKLSDEEIEALVQYYGSQQ